MYSALIVDYVDNKILNESPDVLGYTRFICWRLPTKFLPWRMRKKGNAVSLNQRVLPLLPFHGIIIND